MKHSLRALILLTCLASPALLSANPAEDKMTFVPWTGGTFKSDWPGIAGRTYFYQWSQDLETWNYAPFMAFGAGPHEFAIASNPEKLFVRLHGIDDPHVTSLQQAKDADFDADGVSNFSEIATYLTFPTLWDTDGDMIPDGLEVLEGTSPLLAGGTSDSDGDGMNAAEEYLSGRDPAVADPLADPSSRSLDIFNLCPF